MFADIRALLRSETKAAKVGEAALQGGQWRSCGQVYLSWDTYDVPPTRISLPWSMTE